MGDGNKPTQSDSANTLDHEIALDPRTRSIAEKRAIGQTYRQLAAAHNVSEKTIQRTLEIPEVEELVFSLQSDMYAASTAELVGLRKDAVETVGRLIRTGADAVAGQMAMKVLDRSDSIMGAFNLERRLVKMVEAIEELVEGL